MSNVYTMPYGNDQWVRLSDYRKLEAERGTYVLALEQIRSAPLAKESSIQRYKRCVQIASAALDAHASDREQQQRRAGRGSR